MDYKDANSVMAAARDANGLAKDTLQPWHLKVNYDILDAHSKIVATGVFEEWWAAKNKWKRSYTGPHYTGTEYHLPEGNAYEGSQSHSVPWPESLIATKLLSPVRHDPVPATITDPTHTGTVVPPSPLVLQATTIAKLPLSCIAPASGPAIVRSTSFEYCFAPGKVELRISTDSSLVTVYNKIGTFQGQLIALESGVSVNQHALLNLHVASLDGMRSDEPDVFKPNEPIVARATDSAKSVVPGSIIAGRKLSGKNPEYPSSAKRDREQGIVILEGTINKEGHVEDLKAVEAPSEDLAQAALKAVNTWTYQPYLLNNQPVSVQTTINVVFGLGK